MGTSVMWFGSVSYYPGEAELHGGASDSRAVDELLELSTSG